MPVSLCLVKVPVGASIRMCKQLDWKSQSALRPSVHPNVLLTYRAEEQQYCACRTIGIAFCTCQVRAEPINIVPAQY